MKKTLLMVVSVVLVAALAIGITVAYLQSETPTDINVMTLGEVEIAQLEYERVVDDNGNWIASTDADKYGYYPDALQEFTQNKPLYPAVFADGKIKWDDRNGPTAASGNGSHQQSWAEVGAPGSNQLFDDSVANVVDKFVFVENTGKSDAYVRTIFAFEQGNLDADVWATIIRTNGDTSHWSWETVATDVVIDGCKYVITVATYKGASSNPNGILAPDAITYPSLLQVYMAPTATNDDCVAVDGNGNGTYDIFVVSQGIQTIGFADAATALNAGFGEITANNHPWTEEVPSIPVFASREDQVDDVLSKGGIVYFLKDIPTRDNYTVADGATVEINLEGNTLEGILVNNGEMNVSGGKIEGTYVQNFGEATISDVEMKTGDAANYSNIGSAGSVTEYNNVNVVSGGGGIGATDGAKVTFNSGSVDVSSASTSGRYNFYAVGDGTEIVINDGTFSFSKTLNQKRAYVYVGVGAKVIITGGNFGPASTRSGYTAGIIGDGEVVITGGTFGFDPSNWVAEGYEAVKDGNVWVVSAK